MLNLLFISDSPKIEHIKHVLQPVLKVIIDVVTDFDHGLKDVFEKRPTTVCIQDQIGGVTGESVARHIQMLLGSSAPTFILLHTGNSKARAIKGLYAHLIDVSQPDETVAEQLLSTLKSLLGDQWDRVYIPPKPVPARLRSSVAVPEKLRENADKFVDDLLSDLETSGAAAAVAQPPVTSSSSDVSKESPSPRLFAPPPHTEIPFGADESKHIQSMSDEIAELLIAEAKKAAGDESSAAPSSGADAGATAGYSNASNPAAVAEVQQQTSVSPLPVSPETSSGGAQTERTVISPSAKRDTRPVAVQQPRPPAPRAPAAPEKAGIPAPPAAAAFRINQNSAPVEEHSPEELLLAFEENYRSDSLFKRRGFVIAFVCIVCAAGGWYLVTQKTLLNSLKLRFMPSSVVQQAPAPVAVPVLNPVPTPVTPPVMTLQLPASIPKEGLDITYSVKNPGWERYVGKDAEFRVFRSSGRIQAVQVLSVAKTILSESFFTLFLTESAGTAQYRITSRTTKAGLLIESGRIQNSGEIMIYRKNGAVTAFVVSVSHP